MRKAGEAYWDEDDDIWDEECAGNRDHELSSRKPDIRDHVTSIVDAIRLETVSSLAPGFASKCATKT